MRIWDEKEKFIQKFYVQEDKFLLEMREKAKVKKCDHMMVAPSEARLLQSIVEIHNSKKIVEIGTLFGYSAIYFARGISGEGKVWTLEKNPENAEIAQTFFDKSDLKNKIELVVGDAHENLSRLSSSGPFDLIFIDADKSGYPDYLAWAEKNIRKGGVIIADNTFLGGTVWGVETDDFSKTQTNAMMEFHKVFSDPKRFKSVIYPSFDGLSVGIKV
jgi:predicted O-methyltransferase YrrM